MEIKIGDYIKHNESEDWERVNLVTKKVIYTDEGQANFTKKVIYTDEGQANFIPIEIVTEVLPYGEKILISENGYEWEPRIFISYVKGYKYPFNCVEVGSEYYFRNDERLITLSWPYAKLMKNKPIKELTVKEIQDLLGYKIKVVE
jgi:hypothetical protein